MNHIIPDKTLLYTIANLALERVLNLDEHRNHVSSCAGEEIVDLLPFPCPKNEISSIKALEASLTYSGNVSIGV